MEKYTQAGLVEGLNLHCYLFGGTPYVEFEIHIAHVLPQGNVGAGLHLFCSCFFS